MLTMLGGDKIGFVTPTDSSHPLLGVETNVRGGKTFKNYQEVPGEHLSYRGVGEKVADFNVITTLRLQNHTYINDEMASMIEDNITNNGYTTEIEELDNGTRQIIVKTNTGEFIIHIGYADATRHLKHLGRELETYKVEYPGMVSMTQREIDTVMSGAEPSSVSVRFKNTYSKIGQAGVLLESQKQFIGCLDEAKNLTEVTATALIETLANGKKFDALHMEWKPTKISVAIWHERGRTIDTENLLSIPMTELNNSLVRVIQGLRAGENSPDLVNEEGMDGEAKELLRIIEFYFAKKHPEGTLVIEDLKEKERAILALGLALKCAENVTPMENGRFVARDESTISGITFHRFGESYRDRFEFYQQQDRKFGYRRDNAEAADFFLLHTTREGQSDNLTRYERVQSENVEKARNWIITELEPIKHGRYDLFDVQKINSILLKGLVPDANLGLLRGTADTILEGRVGTTQPRDIDRNLTNLLNDVKKYISQTQQSGEIERDTVIEHLAEAWACFDAIHPEEEGNGRTGTMLFESWCRVLLGSDIRFEPKRGEESFDLSNAISEALKGDSHREFFYGPNLPHITGDLKPLTDFIKNHLTTTSS
jgi:hypothetical protein